MSGNDILKIALANPDVIVPAEALTSPTKRHSKYGNTPCTFDGLRFDSKAEMARYGQLRLLQLNGVISQLETQPVFQLAGKVKYRGDFRYVENGRVIVEDVKGMRKGKGKTRGTLTRVFINKWKQVIERYPEIKFVLVEA